MAKLANWLCKETALYPERSEQRHWIPLSREAGRHIFGSDWYRVIAAAEVTGLVDRHHSYSDGNLGFESFPKAVRLARQHCTGKVKLHQLNRKPTETAKFRAYRDDNLGAVGLWLASRLPMFTLPTDIEPRNYWDAYLLAQIRSDALYSKRCDYGRFHTPYTVLGSLHRQSITSHVPLSSIDVKQAQPMLLDSLVHTTRPSTVWLCGTNSDIYNTLLPIATQCEQYQERTKTRQRKSKSTRSPQVSVRLHFETYEPATWGRDQVKKNLLKAMFAPNNIMVRQPAYKALKQLYPEHAQFMYEYKRGNHKRLASVLQRMESTILIDGVCGWLMSHHPDAPALTIHDELIVPTDLVEVVSKQLIIEFEKHKVTPILEVEHLAS